MVQSERMDCEEIRLLRWRLQETENERDRLREERNRLIKKLAERNATELSYYFENKAVHDMALVLASQLEEGRQERDRLREERDRFQNLLLVAARFAAQNNDRTGDAQTEFDGHTFSGAKLSAFIMDALEGKE